METHSRQGFRQTSFLLFLIAYVVSRELGVLSPDARESARSMRTLQQSSPVGKQEGTSATRDEPTPVGHDTSVIITSNLIPIHPSIKMINDTFHSLEMIVGLLPSTPVFITVDGLVDEKNTPENSQRLQEYVENLYSYFRSFPHVTILTSYVHKHLSNSLRLGLQIIETEFVYVMQHDLRFVKQVNHTALLKSVREYPSELRMVRFNDRKGYGRHPACTQSISANGIGFHMVGWSDRNHFTTKTHYNEILTKIGPTSRFVESPMMYSQDRDPNCTDMLIAQWAYNLDGPYIAHLNGRLIETYSEH